MRHVAASNYTAARLTEALEFADRENLTRFTVLQPHCNLVEREDFERDLAGPCARNSALRRTSPSPRVFSPASTARTATPATARAWKGHGPTSTSAASPSWPHSTRSRAHDTTVAAVALAWLATRPSVVAPIASARDTDQLAALLPSAGLRLTDAKTDRLTRASA